MLRLEPLAFPSRCFLWTGRPFLVTDPSLLRDRLSEESLQLEKLAMRRVLSLTCHHVVRFAHWLLGKLGVHSRPIILFALPKPPIQPLPCRACTGLSEHVMLEVRASDWNEGAMPTAGGSRKPRSHTVTEQRQRWAAIDFDNKAIVCDAVSGEPLNALELYARSTPSLLSKSMAAMVFPLAANAPPTVSVTVGTVQHSSDFDDANVQDVVTSATLTIDDFFQRLYEAKVRGRR